MRKHNEGYTLVLVMALVLVLSALTSVILGAAQRNLDAHRSGVAYMQAKYQAMGEIEKVIGFLESYDPTGETICLEEADEENWKLSYDRYEIQIMSSSGTVQIECTILIDGIIGEHGEVRHFAGYDFTSYQISRIGGAN